MNIRTRHIEQTRQNGIAVVENLVAILIFSFGILGIVGLLASSMKSSASAKYRNDASMLANQIVGEMWVADKSNAALKAGFESPGGASFTAWKTRVGTTLPGITDTVNLPTVAIDANNVATVTVRWQAPGEKAAHNYVLTARING
jgi:type IV pilus assembly protein PilV